MSDRRAEIVVPRWMVQKRRKYEKKIDISETSGYDLVIVKAEARGPTRSAPQGRGRAM
jgi:hypothetical protein